MTEKDLKLEYKRDTGKDVPSISPDLGADPDTVASFMDYTEWLEGEVIRLRKPKTVVGEELKTTQFRGEKK